MNKHEYLHTLHKKLQALPQEERDSAMAFYSEYFEEAESEQAALQKLPPPNQVAAKLLLEFGEKDKKFPLTVIVLAILSAPVAFPLAIAVIAVAFALAVTLFSVVVSLYTLPLSFILGCIAWGVSTIPAMLYSPVTGMMYLGLSLIFLSLAYFTFIFLNFLMVKIYRLIRKLILKSAKKGV